MEWSRSAQERRLGNKRILLLLLSLRHKGPGGASTCPGKQALPGSAGLPPAHPTEEEPGRGTHGLLPSRQRKLQQRRPSPWRKATQCLPWALTNPIHPPPLPSTVARKWVGSWQEQMAESPPPPGLASRGRQQETILPTDIIKQNNRNNS